MSALLSRRAIVQAGLGALGALAAGSLACSNHAGGMVGGRQLVRFWFSYGGRNRQVLESLVGRFNSSQSGIHVQAVFQGDYFEGLAKLRTAIASGAAPAVSHVVGEVVPYLAQAGVLEELGGYEDAQSLDLVTELAQSGSFTGGGQRPLVSLPFNRSTPIMYLNRNLLERAKLQVPKTWDELRDAAIALTQRDAGGSTSTWGFECPISWWFWVAMVGQAGGKVMLDDGRPALDSAAGIKSVEWWQQMVHKHRVMRPPPGRDYNAWEIVNSDFLAKRAAIVITSTAFLRYLEDNSSFPLLAAPLPADVTRSVPTGGTFFVMSKQAPMAEKQAGWQFLRWMMQREQTLEWASRTGYLPVNRSAVAKLESDGYYQKRPNDRVAMDQLSVASPWPWAANLFRIERECVDPLLEEAVLTSQGAAQLMRRAQMLALEQG